MRSIAAAFAVLWIGAAAHADQTFTSPDGVVWTVRADPRASGEQHESTTLHVLRGEREVAVFVESTAIQSNPTMGLSQSFAFRLGPRGALVVTQTRSVMTRTDNGKGGGRETNETTIVDYVWSGTAFVAGKPKTTKTSKSR